MAQETEIKVRIDDNEALQALREMASLVSQISDGLGGLKMSPDAVPSAPSSPMGKSRRERQMEEFWRTFRKEQREADKAREQRIETFKSEGAATFGSMTSPQSMSSLTNRFGEMIENLTKGAPILGKMGLVAGQVMKAYGRSIAAREARLGEIINLEGLETEMRGVIETGDAKALGESRTKALEKFGLDSTQTRQFMLGVAGAAGFKTTEGDLSTARLERLAGAERTGVSAQGIAALAGALSQNIGQSVGDSLDQSLTLRNIAENNLDLRGAGVDRFLGQMGGFVEGLTARGISPSRDSLARRTADISGRLGRFGKGQRPMQIMNALSGVGQGAFNQIAAPLQEIAQMSTLADIMSRSPDIFSAMQEAERFQEDPENVIGVISGIFGTGKTAQAVLGSVSGIGTRDAKSLLTGKGGRIQGKDRLTADEITKGLTLSKAQAEETGKTIKSLRDDDADKETFKQIISVSGRMERSTLKMTENAELLTKITDAQVKLSETTTTIVNKVAQVVDKLIDLLP